MPTILPRPASPLSGYSAAVRIELNVDGRVHFPSHTGPDFLVFRDPQTLTPASARMVIFVDDVAHESSVEILPHLSPAVRIPIRLIGRI